MAREPRSDLSRFKYSEVVRDSAENAHLEDREPFTYKDRPDNIPHIVQDGDTLASLAQFYYWYLDEDAAQFYWAIAEFQPSPTINPFKPLVPGRLIVIPAPEYLSSEILGSPVEVIQ